MDEKNDIVQLPTPPAPAVCNASSANPPSPAEFTFPPREKVAEEVVPKPVGSNRDSRDTIDLEKQAPPKRKRFANFRYNVFTVYRRLFAFVFCANLAVFLYVMISDRQLLALVDATAVNLVACGLARHPMVVNGIYRVVCSLPRSAPLWLRRRAANAAHYGGVHSGCGVASVVWYIGFLAAVSRLYWTSSPISPSTSDFKFSAAPVTLCYVVLVCLLVMVGVAYPTFRRKYHDYFELTHRFGSWTVLALFVALLMVFVHEVSRAQRESFGHFLITLPAFWLLIAAIIAIVHPWLLLRKVPVKAEPLSTHATRLSFDHTQISFAKGIQVTKHPLRDWHSFAGFPDEPAPSNRNSTISNNRDSTISNATTLKGHSYRNSTISNNSTFKKGHRRNNSSFSIVVSKAGDWTADTIQNPPSNLWKRGSLMRGVGYGLRLFNRIIIVTTGSGIGPCLGFLGDANRPLIKVVWQTRTPIKTYGQGVLDLVHEMGPDPIILDTNVLGRVDMLPIVRQQVDEFQAEAVFVISNPAMTQKIIYEFQSQGIPAYGPIFDS
ncbi:hypothetical protein ASPWEDRAFT_46415 [Aspergillus wentii DTO 134E9]|uniref:Integral membrane protein TmpA n=1 Tax=Aspergillus wentii DTO 134E9 TaxID=1073089 RepID=A0A1L9R415_ASPWE|nr:uncharacterized protein ASPWEDRAFT_46415 [Aspergillus wentii DTO 134E9]KAI9926950.1 hypothetical protein MW887_003330 [Aspergillus wentii]OJJ29665.1 hypothetical protein ASPWEDRAFT_46415 [Aspergillus wentii DTO 134E9]